LFNASGANAHATYHAHSPAAGGQEQPCTFDCSYPAPCYCSAHSRALTHGHNLAYTSAYCLSNSSGLTHSNA
jgi:hypothetical protein